MSSERQTNRRALIFCLLALCLAGCAGPITVSAPVLYPAAVPIRSFPTIVIAGGELPDGDLGQRLADYLAKDGQHVVQRVEVKQLEPMREAGAFAVYSLAVLVEPGLYTDEQAQQQLQPVTTCSFLYGCSTQYQNMYGSAPGIGGTVKLTIFDGPSAKTLQSTSFDARVSGPDAPDTRKQVVDLLAHELERAVDVLQSRTTVELEQVRQHPIVKAALVHIRKGEWDEGRALLETAAQGLGGLNQRVQSRVWYDLAIARWYAPGPDGLNDSAYEAAKRALRLALQLDGTDRYVNALDGLERARERSVILEQQRLAAKHNYALKAATPAPR